ncbi:hypothetical protein ABVT39_016352 [Epinephelus coioides]
MPPTSLYFTLSLYFLSKLVSVFPYSYQTKPLFLSFSDLAALEANSLHQPNKPHFVADHRLKTFAVKCHEDSMEVVMKAYLFDPGRPVEPTHLRLGSVRAAGNHCTAKESGNGELVIRAALTECGSRVMFTRSSVLYNNFLLYSPPPPSPGDVMQAVAAAVPVQCEYDRRYTVSSKALKPTWSPPISIQSAHLDLDFHLRLMTNDWSSKRRSSVYFLGDVMNIEASLDHPHLPLRLYADSCVATLTSDVTSYPRYAFIDHQGFLFLLCSSAADAPELDVWTLAAAAAAAAALLLMIRRSRRSEEKENHWEAHARRRAAKQFEFERICLRLAGQRCSAMTRNVKTCETGQIQLICSPETAPIKPDRPTAPKCEQAKES